MENWLLHYAEYRGWPPFVPGTTLFAKSWKAMFRNLPYDWWFRLDWQLESLESTDLNFAQRELVMLTDLIDTYVNGAWTFYSMEIPDGKERFDRIIKYIGSHGNLPVVPVLIRHGPNLEIVDGSHRMVAWMSYPVLVKALPAERRSTMAQRSATVQAWVGTQPPDTARKPIQSLN